MPSTDRVRANHRRHDALGLRGVEAYHQQMVPEPAPWVHVDDREALEARLRQRGWQVRQWRGLAELAMSSSAHVADELGM